MRTDTLQRTASGGRRPWAAPLAAAALAMCCTAVTYAQVSTYNLSYAKRLQTTSVDPADENAAFEPITGGVVLVNGTTGTETGDVGTGFLWNTSTNPNDNGYQSYYQATGAPFGTWRGNGVYVGNYQNATDGDGQFTTATGMQMRTGPGYPIPFNFTFNGQTFDRVGISGQGWIGFGHSSNGNTAVSVGTSQTNSAANLPLSNTTLNNDPRRNRVVAVGVTGAAAGTITGSGAATNLIPLPFRSNGPTICTSGCHGTPAQQTTANTNYGAPFDNNQYPGAELRYETIGTAPNRVFVVQWLNYGFIVTGTTPAGLQMANRRISFQIRLYETSNKVEVRFGKAWRGGTSGAGTSGAFQTGLGGAVGGAAGVADFSSFGFYNGSDMTTLYWPYSYLNQANHSRAPQSGNYGNAGVMQARMAWNDPQGIFPWNSQGSGSAADYFTAHFTQTYTNKGAPFNNPQNTITNRRGNLPDMMSFEWTPNPCTQVASNPVVSGYDFATNSATFSWTGTGNFDWAVGTGIDPSTATITGSTSSNSVVVSGLARSTTYKAWVRTNCGGGEASQWLLMTGGSFSTLPCQPNGVEYTTDMTINRVEFSDIDNSSTAYGPPNYEYLPVHEDFTSVLGHVESPLSFPISVTINKSQWYNAYVTAFFDWDQDGVFEDVQQIGMAPENTPGPVTVSGTINVPGDALPGNCLMRIVNSIYYQPLNACASPEWTGQGQVEDYTLNVTPASCVPVSGASLVVSNLTASTANVAWTDVTGLNALNYVWELRTSGAPGDPGAVASGTKAIGSTTEAFTGLTSNTTYTFYVRVNCGDDDGVSLWASKSFTTELGCGNAYVSPGGVNNLTDQQFISTRTFCPNNPTDKVQLEFTTWNGLNWNNPMRSRLFIFDGDTDAAPMVPGGNGTAFTEGGWSIPAGGWTASPNVTPPIPNKPPTTISSHASGCLTVKVHSFGSWTAPGGWSAAITCVSPPTCFAPTSRTVTSTAVHSASFSWNPGASPNVEYKVVAHNQPVSAAAILSGTSSTGSATTAATLTANTQYTVYFRGLCDDEGTGDDPSAWSDPGLSFRTKVGCGGPADIFFRPTPPSITAPYDSVMVICPDNPGDVVTYTVNGLKLSTVYTGTALYVHNGPDVSAPLIASALPGQTSGANTIPAGGYYGSTYRFYPPSDGNINNLPPPFTSTHASGCLTVRFRSVEIDTYYNAPVLGTVTCAPAPACSTPDAVAFSGIGGTQVTVAWGNTTEPSIVEYGPVGFTPGTGATPGTNGTIWTGGPVASPATVTGLSATTTYDVYVRQVCDGPTYSANSTMVRFSTSMDCSTAQLISCGVFNADDDAPEEYVFGNAAYTGNSYTAAASCFSSDAAGNGPERLYRFTATTAGQHAITTGVSDLGGTSLVGYALSPVANGCAAAAFTCIGTAPSNAGNTILTFNVPAAGDYYIISDANYQVHKRPFTLNCPGVPSCVPAPTHPANGTVLASSATAFNYTWPAVYGADSYDIYFNGNPVANVGSNSAPSGSYHTANIAALVGLGTTVTWQAVPRSTVYGPATGCPVWNFSVGGNGAANAIPLTSGVPRAGNQYSANGYANNNAPATTGSFWIVTSSQPVLNYYAQIDAGQTFTGRDSWSYFVAGECADSARVNLKFTGPGTSMPMALVVLKENLDTLRLPGTTATGVYYSISAGTSLEHARWDGDDRIGTVPTWKVTPGEKYYIVADGYASDYNFEVTYTEVLQTADSDGDGLLDCADECPAYPGVNGSPCDAGPLYASGIVSGCLCVGQDPLPCTNDLTLEFQTDYAPYETTWQIVHQGTGIVVRAGGPLNAEEGVETNDTCLPDGCYYLRVLDDAGDGMTTGGYILRTSGPNGLRIIDNRNNFNGAFDGFESRISGGQGFCLPLGSTQLIFSSCDKLDWTANKFIVVAENPAVSAQYGVSNANSGYEFWFYDPNGSFSLRRFRSHSTSDGYGTGALRANHFKVNGWTATGSMPHIPANTLLNVRVRGRVAGVNQEFGPACQFKLDAALAACPRVKLQDDPANTDDYSCGVIRNFGGSSNPNNRITANPPQPIPAVASANVRYQFRFRIPGEGICIVRPPQTSARLVLNWTNGPALQNGKTYDVDVRVSLNGGSTWCFGPTGTSQAAACGDTEDWGKVCKVTIGGAQAQGGSNSMAVAGTNAELTMFPNPNNGTQLFVNLSAVEPGVNTVNVDIFELTGKKVTARTIAVQDGFVSTALDLNGEIASGVYMVSITAGSKAYTERLVIQK